MPIPAALLSQPARMSWRENRVRKALVQQNHKSFHSMIIYELDHRLMTVALKKEFLAAEQLARLSSESIKYAFDTGDWWFLPLTHSFQLSTIAACIMHKCVSTL